MAVIACIAGSLVGRNHDMKPLLIVVSHHDNTGRRWNMRLTAQGYVKKVRRLLEMHPKDKIAVFVGGDGILHFARAKHSPEVIGIYNSDVQDAWLYDDALELGLVG
jgi:hypothetical protein